MIILAIYYTIADIVLLGQCFYYRGFTWRDEVVPPPPKKRKRGNSHANGHGTNGAVNGNGTHRHSIDDQPTEYTSLLDRVDRERRGSDWSDRLTHLSPAVPMVEPSASAPAPAPATRIQTAMWNLVAVLMVIGAGVAGWALSRGYGTSDDDQHKAPEGGDHRPGDDIHFDLWGQIFGWLCAVLYLGSRLPQLLLNWRRKSTEGVSMLFFLFACLGNLTYVLSIFAFDPKCDTKKDGSEGCAPGEMRHIYGQYILVNLSWLAGSLGTLLLDMGIFVQFFIYAQQDEDEDDEDDSAIEEGDDERSIEGERWDQRPVLERSQSQWSN